MSGLIDRSMLKFIVVGISNTLIGLAIIYAAKWFLRIDDLTANLMGYGVGIMFSFICNKRWTFGHIGGTVPAFARFFAVLVAAYLLNLITVIWAIRLGINDYLAQALGVVPYTAFSYLGSKHFAFATGRLFP